MKRYFKLSQISLLVGIFLSSCLGSKFLKDDEQILANQKIIGLSGALNDNASTLLLDQKNTRLLFGFPIVHLSYLHEFGKKGIVFGPQIDRKKMRLEDRKEIFTKRMLRAESDEKKEQLKTRLNRTIAKKEQKFEKKKDAKHIKIIPGYSQEKAIDKKDKIQEKFNRKIESESSNKRKNKLRAKKAKKIDKIDRKIKFGNQLMRWGEPLAIYDHNRSRETAEEIRKYLFSTGHFRAEVELDTASYDSTTGISKMGRDLRNWVSRLAGAKYRYINLNYLIDKKQHFYIDSIQYEISDPILENLITENARTAPLKKSYYSQTTLDAERDHIYNLAVNNGYYEFTKQYISFKIDSTSLGKDTLLIREIIRNPPGKEEHKIFYLDSIIFVSDASINQSYVRTSEQYRDITFSFGQKKYSKKVLDWRIALEQDDRYSKEITIETQGQLSYLDNFRFINIKYDTIGNLFIANIFTAPFDKYQTSSEFGFSSTQGIPGPFANINLKNRNTFGSMEVIGLDFNGKLQDLRNVSGISEADIQGRYTSRQVGGVVSIDFPQFLFPIGSYYQNWIGQYNPKTRLSVGVTYEDRATEYQRLEYRGTYAYSWQVQDRIKYTIVPGEVNWIDSRNTESFNEFLDSLRSEGNTYANAFVSAVVTSSAFEREQNYGKYGLGQQGGFIRLFFEAGGHFNNLVSSSLFGGELETFQYLRTNIDLRRIQKLNRKYNLALRFNTGVAYPFGENKALPYNKYFFAGGSSSIRGWNPRRLGPGSFAEFETEANDNPTTIVNEQQEQPGEILIETSVELRRDLVGFVEGALFLDAGNVWLIRDASVNGEREKGVFRFDRFMSQMALAAGAGLRFDLQFLIFRIDLGIKMFDPPQKAGERFVGKELFNDFDRYSQINIGIGYPF